MMPKPWTFNSPTELYKDLEKLRRDQDEGWLKKAQEAREGGFAEPSAVEAILAKFKYEEKP